MSCEQLPQYWAPGKPSLLLVLSKLSRTRLERQRTTCTGEGLERSSIEMHFSSLQETFAPVSSDLL